MRGFLAMITIAAISGVVMLGLVALQNYPIDTWW